MDFTCACRKNHKTQFSLDLHRDSCDSWREGGIPDPNGTQTCKSCFKRQSFSGFPKHPNRKCGFGAKCKSCLSIKSSVYRVENQDSISKQRKGFYGDNKDRLLDEKKTYYYSNQEEILEKKKVYTKKVREIRRVYMGKYRLENKESIRKALSDYRLSIVNGILDFLGPICISCGEKNREFLTIDHVDNDGNLERHLGSINWKRRILEGSSDPRRYRVLCHNCNLSSYHSNPVRYRKVKEPSGQTRTCSTCLIDHDESYFHGAGTDKLCNECKFCRSFRRFSLRLRAQEKLGGYCVCCGEINPSKLSFDHEFGDGSEKRRRKIDLPGEGFCSRIIKGEVTGLRILCFNCNHSTFRGGGTCFHFRAR